MMHSKKRLLPRRVAFLVFLGILLPVALFAQKTEFKLGVGGGVSGTVRYNNFFSDEPQIFGGEIGAHAFFDANYFLLTADFWWGGFAPFTADEAEIDEYGKYNMSTVTISGLLQYPMDYVGGRSVLLLGVGYQIYTGLSVSNDKTPVADLSALPLGDFNSLWLKIGFGDHRSLTDLLYYRFDFFYNFRLAGEATVKSGPEANIALGFWIK
ncbi:MAG: hypothetical protein Ta2B_09800 [Termitinemataceae bacterium]|nr:MAG: hypothetical protein Ta2B_09800 [Termitinemataceae bacterium]